MAAEVNERSRSFGVALTSCTVPAAGKPTFDLGEQRDRARHRHPRRAGPHAGRRWPPASAIVEIAAMDAINADLPLAGDLLVMVNGMGGTPLIELYVRVQRGQQVRHRQGRADRQEPGRQLHHQPGDAGLLGDGLPADRHARSSLWDAPVDTPGPALGTVEPDSCRQVPRGALMDAEFFRAWMAEVAAVVESPARPPDPA